MTSLGFSNPPVVSSDVTAVILQDVAQRECAID